MERGGGDEGKEKLGFKTLINLIYNEGIYVYIQYLYIHTYIHMYTVQYVQYIPAVASVTSLLSGSQIDR